MKKNASCLPLALGLAAAALLAGCQGAATSPVGVSISARIGGAAASPASRALVGGETVEPVTAYRVLFKKIEIGNSETDKFTLWESAAGEVKDIAASVAFDGVQAVEPGTYSYVRLTIGDSLSVDGQVTDAADGTVYSGTGTCVLGSTVYLWGSELAGLAGEATLRSPIVIEKGSSLSFDFAVAGTVSYLNGTSEAAVLGVTKPTLSLTAD